MPQACSHAGSGTEQAQDNASILSVTHMHHRQFLCVCCGGCRQLRLILLLQLHLVPCQLLFVYVLQLQQLLLHACQLLLLRLHHVLLLCELRLQGCVGGSGLLLTPAQSNNQVRKD